MKHFTFGSERISRNRDLGYMNLTRNLPLALRRFALQTQISGEMQDKNSLHNFQRTLQKKIKFGIEILLIFHELSLCAY